MIALIITQDLNRIWVELRNIKITYFLIFTGLTIISTMIAATNMYLLIRPFSTSLRWKNVFYFDLLSLAGSAITPGGVGGMATVVYMLKQSGVKLKDIMGTIFVDKIITFVVALIFLIAYICIFKEINFEWINSIFYGICIIIIMLAVSRKSRLIALRMLSGVKKYSNRISILFVNFLLTIILFAVCSCQYIIGFKALGIDIKDPLLIVISYGIFIIINLLPITISGIGLGEVAALFLWSSLELSSESILAVMIALRFFSIISSILIGAGVLLSKGIFRLKL